MWVATKWPRWVKIVLSLPVLLAILGIAFAVLVAIRSPGKPPISTSIPSVTTTPIPVINNSTPEGNRIINNDGEYSFILPKSWKAKISSYSKTDMIFGETFLNDLGIGDIKVSSGYKSLSDALSKQNPKNVSNITQITVDSAPGIIEDLNATDGTIKVEGKVVIVYKDKKTYTFELLSKDFEDITKFQELLSSFKFIP